MNRKRINRFLRQKAAEQATKNVTFLFDGNFAGIRVETGFSLPLVGRTSTHLHPSRQGWVAVTPKGREVVILDDVVREGYIEIRDAVYP